MSTDDEKPDDPIEDVRKGLGLLFRAAKNAAKKIPTKNLEEVVVTGAREVGRAVENVANTIEKQVFKREPGSHAPPPAPPQDDETVRTQGAPPPPPADAPPGPRVDAGDDKPRS